MTLSDLVLEVQDFTQSNSSDHLAVVVRYPDLNRSIEIDKDGTVRFISTTGTLRVNFQNDQKLSLLRQNYIQMLIENDVRGEAFEQALKAIARVDHRLQVEKNVQTLEKRTNIHLHNWEEEQGETTDILSEEEQFDLLEKAINQVRTR